MQKNFHCTRWLAFVVALLSVSYAACSKSPPMPPEEHAGDKRASRDINSVEAYVTKTRGWKFDECIIERRPSEEGLLVFWVLNKEDEKSIIPGGGKSFEVKMDPTTCEIIKELRFQ